MPFQRRMSGPRTFGSSRQQASKWWLEKVRITLGNGDLRLKNEQQKHVEKVNIEERHVWKSAEFIAVDFVLFHKYTYIRPYALPNMITQNLIQPLQTALVLHDTPRKPRVS
jgi:hypothetical protein